MGFPFPIDVISRVHDTKLSQEVIQILILIHVSILISSVIIYYLIKLRIYQSIRGPSQDAKFVIPRKLLASIKKIYVGMCLCLFNNTIVQVMSLFNLNIYYFVLSDSILFNIGMAIYILGLYEFIFELPKKPMAKSDNIRYIPLGFLLLIVTASTFEFRPLQILLLIYLIGIHVHIFGISRQVLDGTPHESQKIMMVRITIFQTLIMFSTIVLPALLFIDVNYQTIETSIELLMFTLDSYFLIASFFVFFIIIAPKWIRDVFGVSDQIFYHSRDPRLDYTWVPIDRTIPLHDISDVRNEIPSTTLFIADNLLSAPFVQPLTQLFETHEVLGIKEINSPVVEKFVFQNNTIVFLSDTTTDSFDNILEEYRKVFQLNIKLDEKLQISEFEYSHGDAVFGLISSITSPKNPDQFWWLLLAPRTVLPSLVELLVMYEEYFMGLNTARQVLCVVKFPYFDGVIEMIKPDNNKPQFPDQKYLTLL